MKHLLKPYLYWIVAVSLLMPVILFCGTLQSSMVIAQQKEANPQNNPSVLDAQKKDFERCLSDYNVLSNKDGEVIWFTTSKLKKISKITSKPKPIHGEGITIATVEVVIDEFGKVQCTRAVSGHPLVRFAAINASKKWLFEPYTSKNNNNNATAIAGRISYKFVNDKVSINLDSGEQR